MMITIRFISKEQQKSHYDWADISCGSDRVGKARCTIQNSTIIIYSINIYPIWEGHGYGREFVDHCKGHFEVVIADRVRPSAIGFWEAMGFCNDNDGNWSYRKKNKA
ncbi:MAG: hypothetical protein Q7T80_12635 [Methanoregula sp.]|nr:hypothetical protein [Methanoregula sp.]